MIKIIVTTCCFLIVLSSFSQEKETIQLKKNKATLYQGVENEISNWYLYIEDDFCYLANLELPPSEIITWFEQRKNSQNIFKGEVQFQQYQTLILMKENEPDVKLNFYLEIQDKNTVKLTNMDDTKVYTFVKK